MFSGRAARGVPLYGIMLHTTGSGLPIHNGDQALADAVRIYTNSGGPHYVIGHKGEIIATVADERIRGAHAGMSNTSAAAINAYNARSGWESMVSPEGARLWHERWPGKASPVDLIPNGNLGSINTFWLGIEMIPITGDGRTYYAQPPFPGARFSAAQHDAAKALAHDIARRHSFPSDWTSKNSTRLLGHSDVNPVERDRPSLPLWDPGYHIGAFNMDVVRGGNLGWLIAGGIAIVAGVLVARYIR
jgi:hypothetical protein